MIKYIVAIMYCLIGYLIAEKQVYKYEFGKIRVMLLWPIFIIVKPILRFILKIMDLLSGGKLPKLSCYGCMRENCKNRSWTENRLCRGYAKEGEDH